LRRGLFVIALALGWFALVFINPNRQLGTATSSARFQDEIRPMDKASEAILALKPVTFRYKKELDPDATSQFGLVAEDVEKVNPDLVVRDTEGKVYSVRCEVVNAMLLNEFLKEHRKNEEQEAAIARQQKQIEALTAGIQKVSAQVELIKPAPQAVANRH
jgi:endosialidase-like protein